MTYQLMSSTMIIVLIMLLPTNLTAWRLFTIIGLVIGIAVSNFMWGRDDRTK